MRSKSELKRHATNSPYRIEHDNDTGPGDESFFEWWDVMDGDVKVCRCDSEQAAFRVKDALVVFDSMFTRKG